MPRRTQLSPLTPSGGVPLKRRSGVTFRDITYCASDCVNADCAKNYSATVKAAAEAEWGKNPPIDFRDFKPGCDDYISPHEQTGWML